MKLYMYNFVWLMHYEGTISLRASKSKVNQRKHLLLLSQVQIH